MTFSLEALCHDLSEKNTILCLEFCQALIEDVKNANLEHAEEARIDIIVNKNIHHLSILLHYASEVLYPISNSNALLESTFKAYGAWALNHPMAPEYIHSLLPITNYIFNYVQHHPHSELYNIALDEISEVLNRFPSFYDYNTKTHLAHILGDTGRPMIARIEKKTAHIYHSGEPYIYEDDDDVEELQEFAQSFSKAAAALCELAISGSNDLPTPEISLLFQYLLVISNFPGFPYVDSNLSMFLLEFWSSYADSFLDSEDSVDFSDTDPYIVKVIEIFWNKSILPSPAQHVHWRSDSWDTFALFRSDFWEFLDSTYVLVGAPLFNTFVTNVLDQLNEKITDWARLEASLACINALSENITYMTNEYAFVAQLLQSPLLEQLSHLDNMHIRTTGVNFIGSYDSFFEQDIGKPFLFPALDYLFKSLPTTSLSDTASRSIQKLCSSSRRYLSDALPSFFGSYTGMSLYEILGNSSHERTVLAISCVIQAVDDLEKKASLINDLTTLILAQLEKVYHEYDKSTHSADGPDTELFVRIVSLLHCLANIGQGLQLPEGVTETQDEQKVQLFWDSDKFHTSKQLLEIMGIFALSRPQFNSSLEICECCCAILKSGFSETSGPFVFPIDTELEFIKAKYSTGPVECYSSLIDLACSFIASRDAIQTTYINSLLNTFFPDLGSLLDYEPEAQSNSLQLLREILAGYSDAFLEHAKLDVIIHFAIQMLNTTDRFTLSEATLFWTVFLSITNNRKQVETLAIIGPELAGTLIAKVSGDAARSELEFYSEVAKVLMSQQKAEPWFKTALLTSPKHPADKIDPQSRQLFFDQLVRLRGNRETNSVITQFWLTTRGIEDYY